VTKKVGRPNRSAGASRDLEKLLSRKSGKKRSEGKEKEGLGNYKSLGTAYDEGGRRVGDFFLTSREGGLRRRKSYREET